MKRVKSGGRKKGTPNRVTKGLRETIQLFVEDNFDQIKEDFEVIKPHERIKLYIDLMGYVIPKMKAVEISSSAGEDKPVIQIVTNEPKEMNKFIEKLGSE